MAAGASARIAAVAQRAAVVREAGRIRDAIHPAEKRLQSARAAHQRGDCAQTISMVEAGVRFLRDAIVVADDVSDATKASPRFATEKERMARVATGLGEVANAAVNAFLPPTDPEDA